MAKLGYAYKPSGGSKMKSKAAGRPQYGSGTKGATRVQLADANPGKGAGSTKRAKPQVSIRRKA